MAIVGSEEVVTSPVESVSAAGTSTLNALLSVDGLRCEFGGVVAVAEFSLACQPGTITGLIGPNGAGKSTVLGAIAGSVPVTSGVITLAGRRLNGLPEYRRSRLGLARTFQIAGVCPSLTVLENVMLGRVDERSESFLAALIGRGVWGHPERSAAQGARELLDRFGLAGLENKKGGELSGGQRRLVEVMRALMSQPKLLLLDEPMAGISPELAKTVGRHLVTLADEGIAVLMVEHELRVVDEICSRVVVMAQGQVLAAGSMTEIRSNREVLAAYLVG